jgi:hypothetical protein
MIWLAMSRLVTISFNNVSMWFLNMCNFLGVERSLTTSRIKKAEPKVDCGETFKLLNLKQQPSGQ